ncbi:hypothetical protein GPECTOR_29g50 [Gonium pectorale]|uniref:Right handed beta helix domain-containing protein n=1 Tax=Gonium pectorale TaxID=33097 RepID=A0A150GER5_GONPE|nr:hypothetical protein GPECTOR_29g50 [Gonium pectorale]|eukprot:KXZ48273.1 hypothetical protein GPECTOR_29g50 [Gonium pectorale]
MGGVAVSTRIRPLDKDTAEVYLIRTTFSGNTGVVAAGANLGGLDDYSYGGLAVSSVVVDFNCNRGSAVLFIEGSVFEQNGPGLYAGCVRMNGDWPIAKNPYFTSYAPSSGCSLYLTTSQLRGCTGLQAGAVLATNAFRGCAFEDHVGTALHVGSEELVLAGCRFARNAALPGALGGALHLTGAYANNEDALGPSILDTVFDGNTALAGGAVYIGRGLSAELSNCTFSGNRARSGGAIMLADEGGLSVTDSGFLNNTAVAFGEPLTSAAGEADPRAPSDGCGDGGGGALCILGSTGAQVALANTSLSANSAALGGALYAANGQQCATLPGGCQRISLGANVTFTENYATLAGGALYWLYEGAVDIRCDREAPELAPPAWPGLLTQLRNQSYISRTLGTSGSSAGAASAAATVPLPCASWTGNAVALGGYGPSVASSVFYHMPVLVDPIGSASAGPETRRRRGLLPEGGGGAAEGNTSVAAAPRYYLSGHEVPLVVSVFDYYGQWASSSLVDSSVLVLCTSLNALGQKAGETVGGSADFAQLRLRDKVNASYVLTFEARTPIRDLGPVSIKVFLRPCRINEELNAAGDTCTSCAANSYSLMVMGVMSGATATDDGDGSAVGGVRRSCAPCPEGAVCSSAALGGVVVPEQGYWHSAPLSAFVMRCLNPSACSYPNRTALLGLAQADLVAEGGPPRGSLRISDGAYRDLQCAPGHWGNLCGSCSEGWGKTGQRTCLRCGGVGGRIGYGLLIFGITLASILLAVRAALAPHLQPDKEPAAAAKGAAAVEEDGAAEGSQVSVDRGRWAPSAIDAQYPHLLPGARRSGEGGAEDDEAAGLKGSTGPGQASAGEDSGDSGSGRHRNPPPQVPSPTSSPPSAPLLPPGLYLDAGAGGDASSAHTRFRTGSTSARQAQTSGSVDGGATTATAAAAMHAEPLPEAMAAAAPPPYDIGGGRDCDGPTRAASELLLSPGSGGGGSSGAEGPLQLGGDHGSGGPSREGSVDPSVWAGAGEVRPGGLRVQQAPPPKQLRTDAAVPVAEAAEAVEAGLAANVEAAPAQPLVVVAAVEQAAPRASGEAGSEPGSWRRQDEGQAAQAKQQQHRQLDQQGREQRQEQGQGQGNTHEQDQGHGKQSSASLRHRSRSVKVEFAQVGAAVGHAASGGPHVGSPARMGSKLPLSPLGQSRAYGASGLSVGDYWSADLEMRCYQGLHLRLALAAGVPGLLLFAAGVPLASAWWLRRNRRRLADKDFLDLYGTLYQEYEERYHFWESVVILRKLAVAAVVVFAGAYRWRLTLLLALGVAALAFVAQAWCKPYQTADMDQLELLGLAATLATFYLATFFMGDLVGREAQVGGDWGQQAGGVEGVDRWVRSGESVPTRA